MTFLPFARSQSVKRSSVILVLLTTAGCAWFGEDSQRAQMMAMPEIDKTLSSAFTESASRDRWPQQDWWTQFADPVLNGLITSAISDNPNIKAVAARLQQSQALVDAQAAEQYPTVDANISFSAQRYSANSVQAKFAGEHFRQLLINPFVLRYHLDFWGHDEAALQGAIGRSLAAKAELADARLLLAVEVTGTYFDLLAATEKLKLAGHIVADRESLAKLQRIRLSNGLSSEAPVLQTQITLNRAKQLQASLRAEVELHRHRLATLAGQGPDWGRTIQIGSPKLQDSLSLPRNLPLHLLSRRPDLTSARLHVEAAAEEIKVAETEFYPDVNLIAFTGLHSASLTDIILQGSSLAYAVGPSIELPIFQGGRLRANLSYQEAAYDAAVERYNTSLVEALQEVADALSRWHETEARLEKQRGNISAAEANVRLSNTLLQTGLADQVQALQARVAENSERLLLTSLETEQRKASVSVIKALGGGYDDTINITQAQ